MEASNFYMTPQEYADLIVQTLEESDSFKRDQRVHPIDLEVAFSTVSFAIASGIDAVIKRNAINNKKTSNNYTHTFTSTLGEKVDSFVNRSTEELKRKTESLKNKYNVDLASHNINNYSEWKKEQSKV